MITSAIIDFFRILLETLLGILPSGGSFPASVNTAVNNLSSVIHSMDFIIPTNAFMSAFIFLVSIQIAIFGMWSFITIFRLIRG